MGTLFQQRLHAQGHLHALFCRSASACRQDDGLCHLSQCPAEREVPVLHRKASDTRRLGISQTVKHVDDTPIRREIQQYLGSRPTYYRYMNGQLTLTPKQQKGIINIFRSYGYTEELDFDNYIDRYSYE